MALGKGKIETTTVQKRVTETMAKVADNYDGFEQEVIQQDMKLYTFHMDPTQREILRHHFKSKRGLGWAQGVRAILYEYMRQEKII